jgi:hypothetical protein
MRVILFLHCATSQKVTRSILDGIIGIFLMTSSFRPHYDPRMDSVSVSEISPTGRGNKGGRCIGLTILPPSCVDCLEILAASTSWSRKSLPDLYRDCFTFNILCLNWIDVKQDYEMNLLLELLTH